MESKSSPPASPYQRIEILNLFQIASWQDEIPWKMFLEGVEIHRLYGDGVSGPCAALLRFQKGAVVPQHTHTGFEHLLILSGSQHDQNSTADRGTLMINPPGTTHRAVSEEGCIVLAIYESPGKFETV